MGKYSFFLVNFGWFSNLTANTLEEAREVARKIGFEVVVKDRDGTPVASWGPISGWRTMSWEK